MLGREKLCDDLAVIHLQLICLAEQKSTDETVHGRL